MKPYSILFIISFSILSCDNIHDVIEPIPDPCNEYVCEYSKCDVVRAKHELLSDEYKAINSYISSIASATESKSDDYASDLYMLIHFMVRRGDDIQYQIKQLEESGCL